tara:strand:+ start:474 stop:656 length:183 start_codon:yes stop_codon:yes gene_type:complete
MPSPETDTDFNPLRLSANKAPPGVVASGVVTSIALLLTVIDFELSPAIVIKASEPAHQQL